MVASRGSTPATGAAEERRNGHRNSSGSYMTPLGVSPVGDEKQENGEKEGDGWRVRTTSAAGKVVLVVGRSYVRAQGF